jgi:RecJ-like exonuclease
MPTETRPMSEAPPVPALADRATRCADRLRAADSVLLVSHIDADGLTSAAIAASALERAGIPFEVAFSKQLDAAEIAGIADREEATVLFTDLGSGQLADIVEHEERGAFTPVIADHHQPANAETEYHCNPLLEGIDGASELSGAGTVYVLARALASGQETGAHKANRDLAPLAVVGAVGDMQASDGALEGANAAIVEEGEAAGVIETTTDLALYGRQTRPLPKFLEYASDVRIPGITGDERGTLEFLDGLGLELHDADGEWRPWADLTAEERETVASSLLQRAIDRGVRPRKVDSLVGTSYTLTAEPVGTALRDASEFSTLLNATARYERADVGLAVCLGNRDGALDRARTLLSNHRRNLSEGLDRVKEQGVTREAHCQWFHAGDEIRPTIVGIVAGMAVGVDGVERGVPILAFADDEDGVKVSARGTPGLVRQGLDLSAVMGTAAPAVGGEGGGHDVAAGATIPAGSEDEFVDHADRVIGEQLG